MTKRTYSSFTLPFILLAFISLISSNLVADEASEVPEGSWGLEIEGIGKIKLSCSKKNTSIDKCSLLWIFSAIPVQAEISNGNLKLFTNESGEEFILIALKSGVPYKFIQSSIITPEYYSHYSLFEFSTIHRLSIGSYQYITSDLRHNSEYNSFRERGHLIKLPDSLPDWILSPAALLLKNSKFGADRDLHRIIESNHLNPNTLRMLYQYIRDNKEASQHYLTIIASNHSTPVDVLDKLFNETPESHYHYMSILNAVLSNPNTSAEYRELYINKVKTGDKKIQSKVLDDDNAPPEMLDWLARHGKAGLNKYDFYRHKNIWPETLDYLYEQPQLESKLRTLAANSNISEKTILKLANREYKGATQMEYTLAVILSNKGKFDEAVQISLSRLASGEAGEGYAAKDERIPREIIDQLITSNKIMTRHALSSNSALSADDLTALANDEYAFVARYARNHLENRFKDNYDISKSKFIPLADLKKVKLKKKDFDLVFEMERILNIFTKNILVFILFFWSGITAFFMIIRLIKNNHAKTTIRPALNWTIIFSLSIIQAGCLGIMGALNSIGN